jgi:hypothetical protein
VIVVAVAGMLGLAGYHVAALLTARGADGREHRTVHAVMAVAMATMWSPWHEVVDWRLGAVAFGAAGTWLVVAGGARLRASRQRSLDALATAAMCAVMALMYGSMATDHDDVATPAHPAMVMSQCHDAC